MYIVSADQQWGVHGKEHLYWSGVQCVYVCVCACSAHGVHNVHVYVRAHIYMCVCTCDLNVKRCTSKILTVCYLFLYSFLHAVINNRSTYFRVLITTI